MQNNNSVLRVENLVKTFKSRRSFFKKKDLEPFTAVNNISFELHHGEILGLLGPNGAGKTTTIQMLLSTLTPTSGNIYYFGQDFFKHRSDILQRVGYASGYAKLPGNLTITENLLIYGKLYGLSHQQCTAHIKQLLTFFDIWDIRNKQTRTLSAGQMTRVMLTKAFLNNPPIILLDEPTASLDPDIAHDVRQFILQRQQEYSISILFTSHNMSEVEEICDRVLVLKNGNIIADDTPENLAQSIANSRVNLIISNGLDKVLSYLKQYQLPYSLEKHTLTIEIHEKKIANLLTEFAHKGIVYSQISIDHPTLEDYFLNIAK